MSIKVGLCGFSMRQALYPGVFPVVEIQHTFYQPPADGVMRRWRVAGELEITIKAWQLITHTAQSPTYRRLRQPLGDDERRDAGGFRPTAIVEQAWRTTVHAATLLGATCILFQCPASFRPTRENLDRVARFVADHPAPAGVRLLLEPRGPAWNTVEVRRELARLCAATGLVHAVDPFVCQPVTSGDLTYFRLHGITGSRHVYSDDELATLAGWVPRQGRSYVMFNNIPRVGDARRFMSLLK